MKKLVIIGASGHGKVVADIAIKNGYNKIIFLDDDESIHECGGYPIVGKSSEGGTIDADVIIGIGNAGARKRIQESIPDEKLVTLIHPDAVVAEGCESGGHIGENTTMVLVPQIVDAVKIPVIAAGGIADGRGIAAAFMLGAKAVQMGTHFVATEESIVHENYKNAIIKAKDIDSRVTGRGTGHPVRALRNQMTKKYLDLEKNGASFEELEHLTLGGLRKAVVDGDVTNGSVMAGQSAAMVKEIMSCKDLIQKLVSETDALIGGKGFYE